MNNGKKVLLASLIAVPVAQGFTLYDEAPSLSLPEAHALRYSLSISAGYDTNINNENSSEDSSYTLGASVSGSYAKVESLLNANYSFSVGGTYYAKDAANSNQRLFANIDFTGKVSYQIDSRNTVEGSATISYKPDIDYGNPISAPNSQGDVLYWSLHGSVSRTLNGRTSFNLGMNTSGVKYENKEYEIDDREYAGVTAGLSYAYTPLTSLSLNASGRFEFRTYGFDSENLYINATLNSRLSPVTSISLSTGVQGKFIANQTEFSPNLRFSMNNTLFNGDTMATFISFDNENVGTARFISSTNSIGDYLSNAAWRFGVSYNRKLTTKLSARASTELYYAKYSDGNMNLPDEERLNITVRASLDYAYSSSVSFGLNYTFNDANADAGDYQRHSISASTSYSF